MEFSDPAFAAWLRDYVREQAQKIIDQQRPRPSYPTVITIDRVNRKATVQYAGDPAPVPVQMGSIQPANVGQRVRVEGVGGDKYIADVMGPVYVDQVVSVEGWREIGAAGNPAFQGTWVNFGSGYATAAFRKEENDVVRLRGMVKSGVVGTSIFLLPAGYRPAERLLFDTQSNSAVGRIDVIEDGRVDVLTGNNAWISLSGITFVASQ